MDREGSDGNAGRNVRRARARARCGHGALRIPRLRAPVVWSALAFTLLLGGAPFDARAQVRPDSVRRDSVRAVVPIPDRLRDSLRADSLRRAPATGARADAPQPPVGDIARRSDSTRADSIKAPIAGFDAPALFETTPRLRFTRDELLSTGAVNLADVLDRVPGVNTFRSGWMAGVHAASFQGDFRRVRVFLDGMEIDAIQPRDGNAIDLTDVPIWTLDELVVERAAGEVRVWMTSWRTDRTTPYTRADIYTGDLNTNGFRALFARRYGNGMILQFGGEQVATQTGRTSAFTAGESATRGDGSVQTVNLRLGWARGRWSTDVLATGVSRDRDELAARSGFVDLPRFKGSRREAFVRVAYGDTSNGLWSHAVVGLLRTRIEGIASTATSSAETGVSTDTVTGRTQQMLAVGYRGAWWNATVLDRVRPIAGVSLHAPAVRVEFGPARWRGSVFAERDASDSVRRVDLATRLQPLPWLVVSAAIADRAPIAGDPTPGSRAMRAEAGVLWRGRWFGGGIVRADSTTYDAPQIVGAPPVRFSSSAATGTMLSVVGRLYKDLRIDVQAISWDTPQFGRPLSQVRTEFALVSNWLRKFPKGEFGIDARVIHDIRERVPFYYGTLENGDPDIRFAERMPLTTGQLQIRIQRASIFYQYRNLTGRAYEQVPGLTLPPAVQLYGVRWEFAN